MAPAAMSQKENEVDLDRRSFTVAVEGNIGAGKSTFLQHFSDKFPKVHTLAEPVDRWRNVAGHNLLDLQYGDPQRWCHTMQSFVQLTMAENHTQPLPPGKEVKMMERSLHSSRHCFIQNCFDRGMMTEAEFNVLKEWYDFLSYQAPTSKVDIGVDMFVYLRTSPEVAYKRLKARSRDEEQTVPLDYLKQLHALHEDWLLGSQMKIPVVVVDADLEVSEVPDVYSRHESKILGSSHQRASSKVVLGEITNGCGIYF